MAQVATPQHVGPVRTQARRPMGPGRLLELLFVCQQPQLDGASPRQLDRWLLGLLDDPLDGESRELYLQQARLLGWRVVRLLQRFQVRVHILPAAEYRRRSPRPDCPGAYHERHGLWVRTDALRRPHSSTLLHEFGHALDHLMSMLCRKRHYLGTSTMLWYGFAHQRKGFVTAYAATRPCEYLAESVEAYFLPHQSVWLEHNDPGMHAFLKAMFELSDL